MPRKTKSRSRQSVSEAMLKSAARAVGSQIGRSIVHGILDTPVWRGQKLTLTLTSTTAILIR